MANRDYYGDNAPQQLDTMKDTQQSDFANISESHTSQVRRQRLTFDETAWANNLRIRGWGIQRILSKG